MFEFEAVSLQIIGNHLPRSTTADSLDGRKRRKDQLKRVLPSSIEGAPCRPFCCKKMESCAVLCWQYASQFMVHPEIALFNWDSLRELRSAFMQKLHWLLRHVCCLVVVFRFRARVELEDWTMTQIWSPYGNRVGKLDEGDKENSRTYGYPEGCSMSLSPLCNHVPFFTNFLQYFYFHFSNHWLQELRTTILRFSRKVNTSTKEQE